MILVFNYTAILNVEVFLNILPEKYFKEDCQEDCKRFENYIDIIKNKFDLILLVLSSISICISSIGTLWSAYQFCIDFQRFDVEDFYNYERRNTASSKNLNQCTDSDSKISNI